MYITASKMLFKFSVVLVNLLLITAAGCKANEVAANFNKTKSPLEIADTANNVSRVDKLTNKPHGTLQQGTVVHVGDLTLENGNQTKEGPNSETSLRLENKNKYKKVSARKEDKKFPKNCVEAMDKNSIYGIVKIKIQNSKPFEVVCKRDDKGIPWLLIQRRSNGMVDFFRKMKEYERGFGDLFNEFFLGLKNIHALTSAAKQELWIQLEDWDGNQRWAKYSNFEIGDAKSGYELKSVGQYTGDANDSFTYHLGNKWSTKNKGPKQKCSNRYKGAWWYKGCYKSNLNGLYTPKAYGEGICWKSWHGFGYSLKYVHMAIRPVVGK